MSAKDLMGVNYPCNCPFFLYQLLLLRFGGLFNIFFLTQLHAHLHAYIVLFTWLLLFYYLFYIHILVFIVNYVWCLLSSFVEFWVIKSFDSYLLDKASNKFIFFPLPCGDILMGKFGAWESLACCFFMLSSHGSDSDMNVTATFA